MAQKQMAEAFSNGNLNRHIRVWQKMQDRQLSVKTILQKVTYVLYPV